VANFECQKEDVGSPLSHLLDDEKTLLDNFDRLGMADEMPILFDEVLVADTSYKVISAVKVVEIGE
jgi:hypothetical protein